MQSTSRTTKPPKARASAVEPEPDAFRRFTPEEYDRLAEIGILRPDENVELIHGQILEAMPANPAHKKCLRRILRVLTPLIPDDFVIDTQAPVAIRDSRPEPDVAVAVGPEERYDDRHAGPGDLVLVIEVADTSLAHDRGQKLGIYAAAKVPVYWIVNLIDRCVEVHTSPRGGKNPTYRRRTVHAAGDRVPVVVGGTAVGDVAVDELLP